NLTYDGVDICGDRLHALVRRTLDSLAAEGRPVRQLSFVGYSMGGLITRYVAGKLFAEGLFDAGRVVPLNFVTIATPHLGAWRMPSTWLNRAFNYMVPVVTSRSGSQMVLQIGWKVPERMVEGAVVNRVGRDGSFSLECSAGARRVPPSASQPKAASARATEAGLTPAAEATSEARARRVTVLLPLPLKLLLQPLRLLLLLLLLLLQQQLLVVLLLRRALRQRVLVQVVVRLQVHLLHELLQACGGRERLEAWCARQSSSERMGEPTLVASSSALRGRDLRQAEGAAPQRGM
ncbi:hypothetical protein TSOC_014241, partial [Tetrabaena socialis]